MPIRSIALKLTPPLSLALVSLGGGVLMGTTVAPVGAWWLGWIALVPLWVAVARERRRLVPLLWGLGYHGVALFWITGVHPMTWMGVPWGASLAIALFCWIFITLWGAALPVAWAQAMRLAQSPWQRLLLGVALWCGLETLWSYSPLWWTSLSYTQSPHNLAILHLGQLSGPTAVTLALVAVNGALAEAMLAARPLARRRHFAIAVLLLLGFHLGGFALLSRPLADSQDSALRVGIIQGNIPNEIKLYSEGRRQALDGYATGYETLSERGVEAILMPETAIPVLWREASRYSWRNPVGHLYGAIANSEALAWVGAFGQKGDRYTNSLFTVSNTGDILSRYDKVKLVPLGEYIPFEDLLGRFIDRLSPLNAHLAAGNPEQTFETPFGGAIAGICYESAFSYHFRRQAARGGRLILSASNNAHYAESMPAQHHAQDVMRAIETDRWAVRATNTGYSAIVDPHGRTRWKSGINTYETHAGTVYWRDTRSLYVRWGDWLTWVLLGLGAIVVAIERAR